MGSYEQSGKRKKRVLKPLDEARLKELGLAYVARFSTTTAKLERYLLRKLRERGWDGEAEADPAGIAAHFAKLGYIDDETYARARSGSLLRRGYGARRVNETLRHDGIDEHIREDIAPSEAAKRHAALRLAEKRRFGPFALEPVERDKREKQVAAMLRAGHSLDTVRQILNAATSEAAHDWASEYDKDELDDADD